MPCIAAIADVGVTNDVGKDMSLPVRVRSRSSASNFGICGPTLPPANRDQCEAHDPILRQLILADAVRELRIDGSTCEIRPGCSYRCVVRILQCCIRRAVRPRVIAGILSGICRRSQVAYLCTTFPARCICTPATPTAAARWRISRTQHAPPACAGSSSPTTTRWPASTTRVGSTACW